MSEQIIMKGVHGSHQITGALPHGSPAELLQFPGPGMCRVCFILSKNNPGPLYSLLDSRAAFIRAATTLRITILISLLRS